MQALRIKKGRKVHICFPDNDSTPQCLVESGAKSGHDTAIRVAEREKMDRAHGERFRPYFSILWYNVTRSMSRIDALRLTFHPVSFNIDSM